MTHHARGATIGKRAYDPTTGRFLARDPLGRAPLFFADNPYAYAGNNPVSNVDPSGQYRAAGAGSVARESGAATNKMMARVVAKGGTPAKGGKSPTGCSPTGGAKMCAAQPTNPGTPADGRPTNENGAENVKDIALIGIGALAVIAGSVGLFQFVTNPAAEAVAALAIAFGATPETVVFGVLAVIATGLSTIVHAVARILSRTGMLTSAVASGYTGLELVIDALAAGLFMMATVSTMESLVVSIGRVIPLLLEVVAAGYNFINGIQDVENFDGIQMSGCQASCAIG